MAYRPRVLEDVAFPFEVGSPIVVGAFDLKGQGEIAVWRRLLDGAGHGDDFRVLMLGPTQDAAAEAIFPPSLHSRIDWLPDLDRGWRMLISPDRPERAYAALVVDGNARIVVIGPPDEETLDRFLAAADEVGLNHGA